ncbi:MAG: tol-pal system-associated acyl-CoA thioesterase [Gammaproteobacteria bacterium]|nr:tol-pal system-associated acyl-CoA thioesterase [Gammaproteobacteria bacterium]
MPIRVYYEDTDASGVVYHAAYLRFFERGRTEWLRTLGFSQQALARGQGIAFTVARISLRFIAPARLDDSLVVGTAMAVRRRASLAFHQQMAPAPGLPPLAQADVLVACVSVPGFRPHALPATLAQRLAAG